MKNDLHPAGIPGNEPSLTAEEAELYRLLRRNGWGHEEAHAEALRALADAAEEDGYDGP